MKIAHVTATFPPYYAGTGNVCYHNARVLAARSHDVHVLTSDWPGERDDPPGVTVHRFKPLLRLGNAPLLPQLLKLGTFDLVHLHYPFIFGAELVAASCRLRGIPLVLTYHNDLVARGWRGRLFAAYQRLVTPAIIRQADHVCAVSLDHAACSQGIGRLTRGSTKRVSEVSNGVDTSVFRPSTDGSAVRRRLGISDDTFVPMFVGALDTAHAFKRLDLMLEAIAALPDVDIHAIVVGTGDLKIEHERLAEKLSIRDRVHFAGFIEDLPPYLSAADVLVLPSDSLESFGMVLIEAMACGRPVIASDLPGVRAVVADSVDGVLAPPGNIRALADALCLIADMDSAEIHAMRRAARAKAEMLYDWDTIGQKLESIYSPMADEPTPAAQFPIGESAQGGETELTLQSRVAVARIADRCGRDGQIVGTITGQRPLQNELFRYGRVHEVTDRLVCLGTCPEDLRRLIEARQPDRVISMTEGVLSPLLRRFRKAEDKLPSDLSAGEWREMGYKRIGQHGVDGLGSLGWATGERVLTRIGRPAFADKCRVALHLSLDTSHPLTRLNTISIREYKRIA